VVVEQSSDQICIIGIVNDCVMFFGLQLGLIFDGDGCLQSGRLEALIEHLVPRVAPDRPFIFAFVLSSRLFIRPHELLSTVFHQAFSFGVRKDSFKRKCKL